MALGLLKNSDRFENPQVSEGIRLSSSRACRQVGYSSVRLDQVDKRSIRAIWTYPEPVAANRHIAVLKSAWNWVLERHEVPDNPCIGVKLNREQPRERYVTDDEYQGAMDLAPPPINR